MLLNRDTPELSVLVRRVKRDIDLQGRLSPGHPFPTVPAVYLQNGPQIRRRLASAHGGIHVRTRQAFWTAAERDPGSDRNEHGRSCQGLFDMRAQTLQLGHSARANH